MGTILPFGDEDWIGGLHKVTPPSIELANDGLGGVQRGKRSTLLSPTISKPPRNLLSCSHRFSQIVA